MHPHIVILDNDVSTVTLLTPALETAGFTVSHTVCDPDLVTAVRPDLLILSSHVPQSLGLEICRALRGQTATKWLPIIFLTPEQNPDDCVRSLEAGADDVVAEPISVGELLARVMAHMRRSALQRESNILTGQGIKLDRRSHRVTRHGREVALGPTEYRLLDFLMENKGRALTRAQLITEIWSDNAEIDGRTLDVHLARLRCAIDRPWEPNPIQTVRGVGYIFDVEL
jgi:two-component system phosphate regulon response regulator PhoB